MKKIMVGVLSAVLLLTGGAVTSAGTAWETNISVYVPNHNGNGSTKYQTKATSGAKAGLRLHATQSVKLDVRTYGADGNGRWERDVKGGNTYALPSSTTSGNKERLQFSSGIFEGTNVNAVLDWRSN